MTTKSHAISIIIIALVLAVHAYTYANTDDVIIGKVVKVADGDTITVIENLTQHRIRLYGIDAPERRQDFSNKAKQFVSELVFGNQVRVAKKDVDRYGRIVGIVYVGNVCVNEELVRNGLAWVYRRYCKISDCVGWLELEAQARAGKLGLWSHPDPVPPWEFRRPWRTSEPKSPDQMIKYYSGLRCSHGNDMTFCNNSVRLMIHLHRAPYKSENSCATTAGIFMCSLQFYMQLDNA